jgi:titin
VTIDGTTQPGFSGTPLIELDGAGAGSTANGLTVSAGHSTVEGLVINRFSGDGILLQGQGSDLVVGNYIGTDVTGSLALGNVGNGVEIRGNFNTTIGGTTAQARNLISGNLGDGVFLFLGDSNVLKGNFIGTDVTGTKALGNGNSGVEMEGVTNTTIGGTAAGAGNLISGNRAGGIFMFNGHNNVVQGNIIGTDVTGTKALGDGGGMFIQGESADIVGGTAAGAGNLISGNRGGGLGFNQDVGFLVQGNIIGTDITGTVALGNAGDGIQIVVSFTDNATIGGTTVQARNLISGNQGNGIFMDQSSGNLVEGNYIGTDATGTKALGNAANGVDITDRSGMITVGGTVAGAGNLISGNGQNGIFIGVSPSGGGAAGGNLVQGNLIGSDSTGNAALGNGANGVALIGQNTGGNTIGGETSGAGNVISGNKEDGIFLSQASFNNIIQGNLIGTNISGTAALGNGGDGIDDIGGEANTFGGTDPGAGNLISGNAGDGIFLGIFPSGFTGNSNVLQGNLIGTDITGNNALGNAGNGVTIRNVTNNTIGGTATGAGNTIAFSGNDGVLVDTGTSNAILNNLIFSSGHLGIELINNGNNNQPVPQLVSANQANSNTVVVGSVQSTPKTTITLQFFSDPSPDPSGLGEGRQFLGTFTLTTNANGFANFDIPIRASVPVGQIITATATDPNNNTSEFSFPVVVSHGSKTSSALASQPQPAAIWAVTDLFWPPQVKKRSDQTNATDAPE